MPGFRTFSAFTLVDIAAFFGVPTLESGQVRVRNLNTNAPIWGVLATVGSNGILDQFLIQAKAVGVTVVWSGVVSLIAYKIVDMTIGLRVPEDEEREGLDITSHGETAYSK